MEVKNKGFGFWKLALLGILIITLIFLINSVLADLRGVEFPTTNDCSCSITQSNITGNLDNNAKLVYSDGVNHVATMDRFRYIPDLNELEIKSGGVADGIITFMDLVLGSERRIYVDTDGNWTFDSLDAYPIVFRGGDVIIENNFHLNRNISAQCYTFQDGTTQCSAGAGSGSSYNATYHQWSYNQTTPAISYANSQGWNSTYNSSYADLNKQNLFTQSQNITGNLRVSKNITFDTNLVSTSADSDIRLIGGNNIIFRGLRFTGTDSIPALWYQVGNPNDNVTFSSAGGNFFEGARFRTNKFTITDTDTVDGDGFIYKKGTGRFSINATKIDTGALSLTKADVINKGSGFYLSSAVEQATAGQYSGMQLCDYWNSGNCWYGSDIRSVATANAGSYKNPVMEFFVQGYNTYTTATRQNAMNISYKGVEIANDIVGYANMTIKGNTTLNNLVANDVIINKNISGNLIYGEMFNKSDTGFETINLVTQDVYVKLNNLNCGNLNGVACSNGNLTALSGIYKIDGTLSMVSGGTSEYGVKIFINDTGQDDCYAHTHSGLNDVVNVGVTCILRLGNNDRVNVRVDDHVNPVNDPTIESFNLNIMRIGQ